MTTLGVGIFCMVAALAVLPPSSAGDALPYVTNVDALGRVIFSAHQPRLVVDAVPPDPLLQTRARQTQYIGMLALGGEVEVSPQWYAQVQLESGQLVDGASLDPPVDSGLTGYGRPLDEVVKNALFLRTLSLSYTNARVRATVGRFRSQIAHGLVYDDAGTGIDLELRQHGVQRPWVVQATGVLVGLAPWPTPPQSPLATIRLSQERDLFTSVGIFAAGFFDRSNRTRELAISAMSEAALAMNSAPLLGLISDASTSGQIWYLGGDLELFPSPLRITGDALIDIGELTITLPNGDVRRWQVTGVAADLDASFSLHPLLTIGTRAFYLSGDQPPLGRKGDTSYKSFIAVAPFWTFTNLLFTDPLGRSFVAGTAETPGINGHGVLGASARIEVGDADALLNAQLAYLRAQTSAVTLGGGGHTYGLELDLTGEWRILSWLEVGLELDVLAPGNFFVATGIAWRAGGLLYAHWPL